MRVAGACDPFQMERKHETRKRKKTVFFVSKLELATLSQTYISTVPDGVGRVDELLGRLLCLAQLWDTDEGRESSGLLENPGWCCPPVYIARVLGALHEKKERNSSRKHNKITRRKEKKNGVKDEGRESSGLLRRNSGCYCDPTWYGCFGPFERKKKKGGNMK